MRNAGVGSWPARRARMAPHRAAWSFEGRTATYGELDERVRRLGHGLRSLGVGRGDRVAYLGVNHPALLETLFATGAVGAVAVLVNARLAVPEVRHILDDAGVVAVVHGAEHAAAAEALRPALPRVAHWVGVDGPDDVPAATAFERLIAASPDEELDEPVDLEDPCVLMYTSGTTGVPKGAVISHGNMTWNNYNQLIAVDLRPDERTLAVAPLFHLGGLNLTVTPTMMRGGLVHVLRGFDPAKVLRTLAFERITSVFAVPAMLEAMQAQPEFASTDLSSLRTLLAGGAPLTRTTLDTWLARGVTLQQGYGMTEASPSGLLLDAEDARRKVGSAGKMSFFTDVRVVGDGGAPVKPGEVGEVVLSGPNLMTGYWNRPDATREAFGDGWFRSGDAATVDDEGYVYISGRHKDMYISGGENVYPAEVENVLAALPGVRDAAVVGMPDERWGESGVAAIVASPGAEVDPAAVIAAVRSQLAAYKVPRDVVVVADLPRTASGKVRKHLLRDVVADRLAAPAGTSSTPDPASPDSLPGSSPGSPPDKEH
jgi:fatty-acyl-CoA synthase